MRGNLLATLLALSIFIGHAVAEPTPSPTGPSPTGPSPAALSAETDPITITVKGKTYKLDALVLRRPGADKLPVVLIAHGSAPSDPRTVQIGYLKGWAEEFAHRGWLAVAVLRRGFGQSEGEIADSGNCASPEVGRYLDAGADDLQALLKVVATRPDADMSRVLGIGHSAGSAMILDFASRTQTPLMAVINVSGGLRWNGPSPFHLAPGCDMFTSDMVWNYARFGTTAHMPTLWIYAENDSLFRPGLVSRMRNAFDGTGGKSELVMLPPYGADGHTMFDTAKGRDLVLPAIDDFLRSNNLPTWNIDTFKPLLATLTPSTRRAVEAYLRTLAAEKALVMAPNRNVYWVSEASTLEYARSRALEYCHEKTDETCQLIIEDYELLPIPKPSPEPTTQPSPAPIPSGKPEPTP